MIDYATFDAGRILHKGQRILNAHRRGFASIHEAIHKTYNETESLRETGKILGFSHDAIRDRLLKMGIKLNKRGGANHKGGYNCL